MLGRSRQLVSRALPLAQASSSLRVAQPAAAVCLQQQFPMSVRHMSAPAHKSDDHHAEEEGKEVPNGWLFGEDPSKARKTEAWEWIFGGGMTFTMLYMYVVCTYGPDTSLVRWAREEALHTGFKVPAVAPDLKD